MGHSAIDEQMRSPKVLSTAMSHCSDLIECGVYFIELTGEIESFRSLIKNKDIRFFVRRLCQFHGDGDVER